MNIKIQKLTPELAEDYARFFDTTPHNSSNDGDKCYCVTFCNDKVYHNGGSHWYKTADERRLHGIKRVKDGDIEGYLAYLNGEVVGWCNANAKDNCRECINHMRTYNSVPVDECSPEEKIKFVFCFAIAPKLQGMGVATRMLEFICQDAAADGYDYVEARTQTDLTDDGLRGPLALYKKCGFIQYAEQDGNIVLRKALK